MNLQKLKEKEMNLSKVRQEFNEEFNLWVLRMREIAELLTTMKTSLKYDIDNEKYILYDRMGYRYDDRIALDIRENRVEFRITDFENDEMGRGSIKTEDFMSDNWKVIIEYQVLKLREEESQKMEQKQREKELKELERLKEKYEH